MYPEVLVFACNWSGWSCIETAAGLGLSYPLSVKVVRVSCLSRIHAGLMINAFELGADGVVLLGCEPGICNFGSNGERIAGEYEKARSLLEMLGISAGRLALWQLPAFAGRQFVEQIAELSAEIARMPALKGTRVAVPSQTQDMRVELQALT